MKKNDLWKEVLEIEEKLGISLVTPSRCVVKQGKLNKINRKNTISPVQERVIILVSTTHKIHIQGNCRVITPSVYAPRISGCGWVLLEMYFNLILFLH